MEDNNLDNVRLPRTKESSIFEAVLAIIIIIETIFLYKHTGGDSGVLTIAAILFLVSAVCMACAYRPKWINIPVTIKNYRQLLLKAQSVRVVSIIIALFPAFFANMELMSGSSGTVIGIGFTLLLMGIVVFYVWKIEQAGKIN